MLKFLFGLACFIAFDLHAFDCEQQFENEQISSLKVKIYPGEEIGLHRDECAHLVFALQGGTITRLEADGRVTEVEFPTGVAVYRLPDVEGEFHRSVNDSSESIELLIVKFKNEIIRKESPEGTFHIAMNVQMNCPASEELKDFVKSIPPSDTPSSVCFPEWKHSFVESMTQLIQLVESEKICSASWSVSVDADETIKLTN